MKGIKYISYPRRNGKRGGGAAVAVNLENFTISKLNIHVPKNVEAIWGLVHPKIYNKNLKSIIVCSFYSPPNQGLNPDLVNHLTLTLNNLLNIHKNAGFIIAGDRNQISISALLSIEPSARQLVTKPTHGNNVLDVVCTNLFNCYRDPEILPPLTPDVASQGAPSDHFGVLLLPSANQSYSRKRKIKYIRPMPDSLISSYKENLANVNFAELFKNMSTDTMTDTLVDITTKLFTQTFPEKRIVIYDSDKPWFNEELRALKRKRIREYTKHGKSLKYLDIADTFATKMKEAANKYTEKLKEEVKTGKRGSAYPIIKKLAKHPEENSSSQFVLPDHSERDLSPLESAELLADHFSRISQEYQPLSISSLPPNIQNHLAAPDSHNAPTLSISAVFKRILEAKKPNGIVPGDLPKQLIKQCALELAKPAHLIFNSISKSSIYPSKWKTEHQVPIPKVNPPASEDDLRNIAKTPFLSKVYESFVCQWLIAAIKPYLDANQCGLKGSSINHYLIKFLHFIHQTLDSRKPTAVLTTSIDLSKGFNCVDHLLVIQDLFDMHVSPWLLKIICSYLSRRTMILTYKGATSSSKELNGGTPQGALLGGIIFIKFNGALLRPAIPRTSILHNTRSVAVKYIDDGTADRGKVFHRI